MIYYDDGKMRVRDMEEKDALRFWDGEIAQGWQSDIKKFEMRLADQKSGRSISLTAEYLGDAAGYIHVYPDMDKGTFKGKGYPEIVDFAVLEKYRKIGIGNKLMDVAEEIAGRYADTVFLGVGLHSGYGSAQRMYVKRGYIPDGSGVWYRNAVCGQYSDCCNDDDLFLYLSKRLRPASVFTMEISALTPSQLYISQEKLDHVHEWFREKEDVVKMNPIPIKSLGGRLLMTDGHTRAVAAFLCGASSLPCVWDEDDMDWAAYAADINMCAEEGVTSVEKLASRIVSAQDYKHLWMERCDVLREEWYYKVLKQEEEVIYFTQKPACMPNPAVSCQWDIRSVDLGTEEENIDYFQLYDEGIPVARGCIERYSYEFWEAADIRTYEEFRGRGFGMVITAYLTNRIIAAGKTATCRTLPRNLSMARLMEKCGYQRLYD